MHDFAVEVRWRWPQSEELGLLILTRRSEAGQTVESDEDSDDGQLRHVYDHELDASHAAGRKRKSVALRGSTRGLPGALLGKQNMVTPAYARLQVCTIDCKLS